MMLGLPERRRRYLQIAQDLAGQIDAGLYGSGDRLPAERDLSAQLDVSRTTVREALLALEIMRFVEIRVGSGVFVLPDTVRDTTRGRLLDGDEAGPWEMLEARRAIEGQTAFYAALRADEASLAEIGDSVDRMEASVEDIPRFDVADAEFHTLIARASGNVVFENYVEHLWKLRQSKLWDTWYDKTRKIENRLRSVEDHRVIQRALKRKLPDVAQTAMWAHLDVLAERFFELKL